ncbi:hypothetical protein AKJ65_07135 [candidate division MSBL1 archaeon SCGC-AAA259E19]|uniref:Uncharacterized protein n=1 Tax=candidate division MSBL1 archaeon SCGC-AAA259E19 TaxID=1698264 RepID=A0A133UEW8_9EURY|nr:hypothetical protein AKJ65_07135 [candidate division MSBL1 archaeon SCGC-AAA259E19]
MSPEIGLRGERKKGELGISTRILGRMASYLLEWKEEEKDEVVGVNNYNFYGVALDEQDSLVKPVCHACLEKKSGSFYYRLIPFEEESAPSEEKGLILIVFEAIHLPKVNPHPHLSGHLLLYPFLWTK